MNLTFLMQVVLSATLLRLLTWQLGFGRFHTRKAEALNSLIINTTAKANDTTDILQTFRFQLLSSFAMH